MATSKKRIAAKRAAKKRSTRPLEPAINDGDLRTYTIRDYRLEKPQFTLRQVRVGDEVRFEIESGDLSRPAPPIRESKYLRREQLIEIYRWMLLNRRMETALENLYKQGQVVGGVYFGLGQEACSCASAYALHKDEWLGPMIRNQGSLLVRGFSPADIMMQYMAKAGSPTKGRDASSHFGDIERRNVVSPISTLGDLIPVLAGVALGARLQGKHIAAMTYIGDGGQSTGATYEGLNFAAVQNLGLVLIVENNLWAYSTPADMQFRVKDLAERAIAYGIPGVIVDGTDACQVYDACHEACERARRGEGPTLIEAKMMRMKGHAIHDAAEYVPKPLFEYWKRRDPIARLENYLVSKKKWLTAAENEKLITGVEQQLEADREIAVNSPMPAPESAAGGVYCDEGCHEIKPKYAVPGSAAKGARGGKSGGPKRSEAAVHLK
ncbi:MAG TPA: thiamine pyrophosphate-dependent dehydrogenase E1 component subunit alpha [Terriglobales bacterium]|jgi:TPP-dependent pyruvate/acetoin dehydrogenase alpha subunit|nr:thiamine pyrophosphate-dependent dehydrogenase E1 component subunit alpha [Terriglobales bacterium]